MYLAGASQNRQKVPGQGSSRLHLAGASQSRPEVPAGAGLPQTPRCGRPALHLPALVSGAHGLALDAPRPLLVGAVTDGALVRLHLSPGRDDSGLRKAVWA